MKKFKKHFNVIILLSFCVTLALTTLTSVVVTYAAMTLLETALGDADFCVDIDSDGINDLACYKTLEANGETHGTIAIGWAGDKNATKNKELDLTDNTTFTNSGSTYDVTSVAYAGFRYTLFKKIKLPNTITEFGSEAFAYCTNLVSFVLPVGVDSIPSSCFLDCRSLTNFRFYVNKYHRLYQYDTSGETPVWVEKEITSGQGDPDGETNTAKLYLNTSNSTVYKYTSNWDNGTPIKFSGDESPNIRDDIKKPTNNDYYHLIEVRSSTVNDRSTFTSIGDHAFDSCISLKAFYFPDYTTFIGQSAFQRCSTLTKIYLPTESTLQIGEYAFCDCSQLYWVYFEQNLNNVGNYAFSKCHNDLIFHYGKIENDSITLPDTVDNRFTNARWRNKYLKDYTAPESDKIQFETNVISHFRASDHPEMILSKQNTPIYLDCQRGVGGNDVYGHTINRIVVDSNSSEDDYFVIQQWTPPQTSTLNYYDVETGELIIPSSVTVGNDEIPIKIIAEEAFKNQTALKKVKFQNNLVQICKRAFYKCNNIYELDFENADDLIEISNSIFNDNLSGTLNNDNRATSLEIPPSVKYIGRYAFYGFTKLESLDFNYETSHLEVLGGYAFGRIGESYVESNSTGCIDLILPSALNDSVAVRANINEEIKGDINLENFAAIGPYCFGCDKDNKKPTAIRSVIIAPYGGNEDFSTSLAPNAFARAGHLIRFQANKNLLFVGADAFKDCINLRELFLTTETAEESRYSYPWGTKSATGATCESTYIFSGDAPSNLVIYLDNSNLTNKRAPGDMDSKPWYSESSSLYTNSLDDSFGRSEIPVVDNVDFTATSAVLYWLPGSNSFLNKPPTTLAQYNGTNGNDSNGMIVLAQTGTNNAIKEYTVVRYFYDPDSQPNLTEIDLTNITTNGGYWSNNTNSIVAIGEEAFANDNGQHRGYYFILPNTIETIEERAFYRNGTASSSGVRVVTYKNDSAVLQPDANTYTSAKSSLTSSYCNLPTSLTRIEKDAFHGHYFADVKINSSLTFLGSSAFYTHATEDVHGSQLSTVSITAANATVFDDDGNGLYYLGTDDDKKALLYQAQNITGELDLSDDSDLIAIGMHAVASTNYSTIRIPTSVTNIYGGAFQNNFSLTEFDVPSGSNLTHISEYSNNDGYWSSSLPFDIVEGSNKDDEIYRMKSSQGRAFKNCINLETFNFKNLTHLTKIGVSAFQNCESLENMSIDTDGNNNSYVYYSYSNNSLTTSDTTTNGVLDLSHLNGDNSNATLLSIGTGAFEGCESIKYIHLPFTNGNLYVSNAAGESNSSGSIIDDDAGIKVLVGDKAIKACSGAPSDVGVDLDSVKAHYNQNCFGGNGTTNRVYYYAASDGDVLQGTNTDVFKYWTSYNGGYILFETATQALNYLPS